MIYLFLSSTLSAFLLMEFVNLFLLLKMGLIEILALRVLHDLLLNDLWGVILSWELVLLWAATYGACPSIQNSVGFLGVVCAGHQSFLGMTAMVAAIPGSLGLATVVVAGSGRW